MIIYAAVAMKFNRNGKTVEVVISGHRHAYCWELAAALGVPVTREEEESFLNHKGGFLNRYEAYEHALMCGQLSDTTITAKGRERILFLEDIF